MVQTVCWARRLPLIGSRQLEWRRKVAANSTPRLSSMATASTDGMQTFQLDLPLQCGRVLRGATIAYERRGKLSAAKDNVILHPTSFDATSSDLMYNVGPGKMLDTDKYHVIVVNLFGNGLSTSPSNVAPPDDRDRYPLVTVFDNVTAQAALLHHLGVDNIALIYGYSMGAMQALQWGCMYPNRVSRIAAVCGAARTGDYNKVFLESLRAAASADPAYTNGWFAEPYPWRGLRAFGRVYAGWGLSPAFYQKEMWRVQGFSSLEDFLIGSYEHGFMCSNANNLFAQSHTWQHADVSANEVYNGDLAAALGAIQARTVLMPCTTDRYFTLEEVTEEFNLFPADRTELAPLESDWGHRAGDPSRPGQEADAAYLLGKVKELLQLRAPQDGD